MIIDLIAGARPNFMKVAALFAVADEFPTLQLRLVHTGQHYDTNMSEVFLQQLGLPVPSCQIESGSGSHAMQTAEIMKGYEQWVQSQRPDLCMVVGDVNSTLACAIVAAKSGISIAHVEAGLRSFDRTMPEEINRVITDSISNLLFATEPSGVANLANEGRPPAAIYLVGQVMIDTLFRMLPLAKAITLHDHFEATSGQYTYVTLHRPSNVDDPRVFRDICEQLLWLAEQNPVIFPVHPRTRIRLESSQSTSTPRLHLIEPVGYLESLSLLRNAGLVVTDSGGLQEESSALGVPCLTLRENTERPITLQEGTNVLIGHNWDLFRDQVKRVYSGSFQKTATAIPYWDGQAGRRILKVISTL